MSAEHPSPGPVAGEVGPEDLPSRTDLVVVGGGIAGLSAACHLARSGVAVVLFEAGAPGSGATSAALGLLSPPLRQPYAETVRFRGEETAARAWRFALRSVAALADLVREAGPEEAASLDLAGGHVLAEDDTIEEVAASYQALRDADFDVAWLEADEVAEATGSGAFAGGFRIDPGGALEPGAAVSALAGAARAAGAVVRSGARVRDVGPGGGGLRCTVEIQDAGDPGADGSGSRPRSIDCEMVLFATHVESRRFSSFLGDEVVPVRGQGMRSAPRAHRHAGAFATSSNMNVWRSDPEGRTVLGGWRWEAWDRAYWKPRPEVDDALQADLEAWHAERFGGRDPLRIDRRWSGAFGWTADHLPLVGPLPGRPREIVSAGFSGAGLAWAFGAGRVVAALVEGREPPDGADLLNPRRFT